MPRPSGCRSPPPSPHERQAADVSCSLMAIALERAETEAQLAHQALHDGPNSLWREAAKEVQQVLATRLGLLPAELKK